MRNWTYGYRPGSGMKPLLYRLPKSTSIGWPSLGVSKNKHKSNLVKAKSLIDAASWRIIRIVSRKHYVSAGGSTPQIFLSPDWPETPPYLIQCETGRNKCNNSSHGLSRGHEGERRTDDRQTDRPHNAKSVWVGGIACATRVTKWMDSLSDNEVRAIILSLTVVATVTIDNLGSLSVKVKKKSSKIKNISWCDLCL